MSCIWAQTLDTNNRVIRGSFSIHTQWLHLPILAGSEMVSFNVSVLRWSLMTQKSTNAKHKWLITIICSRSPDAQTQNANWLLICSSSPGACLQRIAYLSLVLKWTSDEMWFFTQDNAKPDAVDALKCELCSISLSVLMKAGYWLANWSSVINLES